jgi:hypothetical protein
MAKHQQDLLKLNSNFFKWAFERYQPWILGNDILYQLCESHPEHAADDVIIAKFWLIGRSCETASNFDPVALHRKPQSNKQFSRNKWGHDWTPVESPKNG